MTPPTPKIAPGTLKLAILNSLCFVSFAIITPVLDGLIREPFGMDNSGTARFMAVHGVATLMFGVVAGVLSDRLGRRTPFIVFGLIGSGAMTILIPRIGHFPTLLVVRFFDGLFSAFSLGLIITRALDLAGPANRNRTMGVMSIAISAGFIIAPILTYLLGDRSLPLLFGLVGAALIAGGLWMATDLSKAEAIAPLGRGWHRIAAAFHEHPWLAVPVVFAFVEKFSFGTLAHLTALAIKDRFDKGTDVSSLAILGFWIVFTIVCVPGSRLIDRFGSMRTLAGGSILYGACFCVMGLVNLPGFIIAMILAGGFCAVHYVPSITLVGEIAGPSQRGISMGVWNTAGSLGIVMGLVLSGRLSEISYGLAYGVAGGLEIVCGLAGFGLLARWNASAHGSGA